MKLIFVYNADGGLLNAVVDIGHKLFSPETYGCLLCSFTHGTFREYPQWRAFREQADFEMEFLHRDEFERLYDRHFDYPIVIKANDGMQPVISREQMAAFADLDDLIEAVRRVAADG